MLVTFDLAGKPLGLYDVMAVRPGLEPAMLEQEFEIVPALTGGIADIQPPDSGGGNGNGPSFQCIIDGLDEFNELLDISYIFPNTIRPGEIFRFVIRYENKGNVDVTIPKATLTSLSGAALGFTLAAVTGLDFQEVVNLFFDEKDGPTRILRPGAKGKEVVYSRAPFEPQLLRYRLQN